MSVDDDLDQPLYLASNPDVADAFDAGLIRSGLAHWRAVGRDEASAGARPTLGQTVPDAWAPRARSPGPDFDASAYLDMNVDLRAAFGGDVEAARRHWAEHGSVEGRYGPGDAPYRERRPDLTRLFARPFGVDFYLAIEERDPVSVAGRRLLRALRRASIEVSIRPFVERHDVPLVSPADLSRPGTFRVSVIAGAPATLRRLLRTYPSDHFDASYVIGVWCSLSHVPLLTDYPTFGAVDEVWVPSAALRDRLAAFAPVPIRHVELPVVSIPSRVHARAVLGLPPDERAVMLAADLVEDGEGGLNPPAHVPDIVRAFVAASQGRRALLVVRADPRSIESAEQAVGKLANAVVLTDQRPPGQGSLILGACDALIASDGIDTDIADGLAAGLAAIAPNGAAVVDFLAGSHTLRPLSPVGDTPPDLFRILGLDVVAPRFATFLGRSRHTALPVPTRPAGQRLSRSMPIVSILLDARRSTIADVEWLASSLAANTYPFWELCVVGLVTARERLPADPRFRLAASRPGPVTRAAVLNDAARHATGLYLLIVRSIGEALALGDMIGDLVVHLSTEPAPDIVLAADPPGCTEMSDRIIAGGPAVRPLAIAREALRAIGRFRDRFDPATEYDALLRIIAARGRVAVVGMAPPARDPDPPAAVEAGRLALQDHLRATAGPLAYAEAGLRPETFRRRTRWIQRPCATLIAPATGAWRDDGSPAGFVTTRLPGRFLTSAAGLDTEPMIILDDRISHAAAGALDALVELLQEQEIGAVGARILHADTTLHHAGLILCADGSLARPGHCSTDYRGASVVHNPAAVGGGVLAIRRTVFIQAGGFDLSLAAADGVTFDLLAADLCLRLRQFVLRTVYTPFAVLSRSPGSSDREERIEASQADRLFRRRWSR